MYVFVLSFLLGAEQAEILPRDSVGSSENANILGVSSILCFTESEDTREFSALFHFFSLGLLIDEMGELDRCCCSSFRFDGWSSGCTTGCKGYLLFAVARYLIARTDEWMERYGNRVLII